MGAVYTAGSISSALKAFAVPNLHWLKPIKIYKQRQMGWRTYSHIPVRAVRKNGADKAAQVIKLHLCC